jgi:hypothetical protein
VQRSTSIWGQIAAFCIDLVGKLLRSALMLRQIAALCIDWGFKLIRSASTTAGDYLPPYSVGVNYQQVFASILLHYYA